MSALGWFLVSLIAAGKISLFAISVRNALRPRALPGGLDHGPGDSFGAAGDDSHEFPLLRAS